MKLDRNTNPDGTGKYALINLRKVKQIDNEAVATRVQEAIETLKHFGVLHFGNESPGDQFFVMKYKDKFTARALRAYAEGVRHEAKHTAYQSLAEFAREMDREANAAAKLGRVLPT